MTLVIVDLIRADQKNWSKKDQYSVQELLNFMDLRRPTYYDERKRIKAPDKYAAARKAIVKCAEAARFRGELTYGYRRVKAQLENQGMKLAGAVIRRLMKEG